MITQAKVRLPNAPLTDEGKAIKILQSQIDVLTANSIALNSPAVPGGVFMQSFSVVAINVVGAPNSATYPIPFPSAILAVLVSNGDGYAQPNGVVSGGRNTNLATTDWMANVAGAFRCNIVVIGR